MIIFKPAKNNQQNRWIFSIFSFFYYLKEFEGEQEKEGERNSSRAV